jgi:hypothetical protein
MTSYERRNSDMEQISNLLLENRTIVGLLAVAFLLLLMLLISASFREQLKKAITPFLIFLGIGLGYYLLTGNSPFQIPSDINNYFNDPHLSEEASHLYYQDPKERYGDQIE